MGGLPSGWTKGLNIFLLLIVAVGGIVGGPAWGQVTYTWVAGPGAADWGTATNWQPQGVPGAGDDALLWQNDAFDRTAVYRTMFTPTPLLRSVHLHATGSGTITLELSQTGAAGALHVAEFLSDQGQVRQTAGELRVSGSLLLGDAANTVGSYDLQGGQVTMERLLLGNQGKGMFQQSGAKSSVQIDSDLIITRGAYHL